MGIIGWMMYILLGIIFFFIISFIDNKYNISKLEKMVISIFFMLLVSGFFSKLGFGFNKDIFIIFIFVLITDIIYSSYFIDQDFFDKQKGNISYYVILLIVAFIINQEFINDVEQVFLTGEDFRLIVWFLLFIFLYKFIDKYHLLKKEDPNTIKYMSNESILISYTKMKLAYNDVCNNKNKDIENIIYSLLIFNNNKRSKILRDYDYFMFRLNGNPRKLGIMQIESKKFITDTDSILLAYKKIEKIVGKKITASTKINITDVLKNYCKDDYHEVKYIFDIIRKF